MTHIKSSKQADKRSIAVAASQHTIVVRPAGVACYEVVEDCAVFNFFSVFNHLFMSNYTHFYTALAKRWFRKGIAAPCRGRCCNWHTDIYKCDYGVEGKL